MDNIGIHFCHLSTIKNKTDFRDEVLFCRSNYDKNVEVYIVVVQRILCIISRSHSSDIFFV